MKCERIRRKLMGKFKRRGEGEGAVIVYVLLFAVAFAAVRWVIEAVIAWLT